MGSISNHITLLVVNSLGGGHTHILKFADRRNTKKPGAPRPLAAALGLTKYTGNHFYIQVYIFNLKLCVTSHTVNVVNMYKLTVSKQGINAYYVGNARGQCSYSAVQNLIMAILQ